MDIRQYHEAAAAAWRALRRGLEGLEGLGGRRPGPGWWDGEMDRARAELEPFRGADPGARRYATAAMVAALSELQALEAGGGGTPRTARMEYGTLEEAVAAVRVADGVTEVSFTDRGGRRSTSYRITGRG